MDKSEYRRGRHLRVMGKKAPSPTPRAASSVTELPDPLPADIVERLNYVAPSKDDGAHYKGETFHRAPEASERKRAEAEGRTSRYPAPGEPLSKR